ncbi:MAG: outer spore coat protein CotE [Bacilli bacterium]|nr:outer spore coat protein CotE [Bacilli bacterium]
MSNYKEIVTKAIISKGKKLFTTTDSVAVSNPSTVLGCWVINHNFNGVKENNSIIIDGSYDVNIWYSYDNDTKTDVVKETKNYHEVVHMRNVNETDGEEIIVRSLKQPNPVKVEIDNNKIIYTIEKELGIELVGDVKVKIEANEEEDNWDEIVEEKENIESLEETIDNEVKEDYIDEKTI